MHFIKCLLAILMLFVLSCAQPRQVEKGLDDNSDGNNPNKKLENLPEAERMKLKFESFQYICEAVTTKPDGSLFENQTSRFVLWDLRENYSSSKSISRSEKIGNLSIRLEFDADSKYHLMLKRELSSKNGEKIYKNFPHTVSISADFYADVILQTSDEWKQRDEFFLGAYTYYENTERFIFRKTYFTKNSITPSLSIELNCGITSKLNPDFKK